MIAIVGPAVFSFLIAVFLFVVSVGLTCICVLKTKEKSQGKIHLCRLPHENNYYSKVCNCDHDCCYKLPILYFIVWSNYSFT